MIMHVLLSYQSNRSVRIGSQTTKSPHTHNTYPRLLLQQLHHLLLVPAAQIRHQQGQEEVKDIGLFFWVVMGMVVVMVRDFLGGCGAS